MLCAILDEALPRSPHRPHAKLIDFVADRPGHDLRYAIDDAKIRRELGWRPSETPRERPAQDRALVSRQPRLVGADPQRRLSRRAARRRGRGCAMKGIILAGGSGTRLYPLTRAVSKQLLPIYDKPMIYYPLSTLMLGGIRDILIITTPAMRRSSRRCSAMAASGALRLPMPCSRRPSGWRRPSSSAAISSPARRCALVLGDNLIYGDGLPQMLQRAAARERRHRLRLSRQRSRALRHRRVRPRRHARSRSRKSRKRRARTGR